GTTFKLPHNSGAYAYCPPLDSRWKGLWDLCSVARPHREWVKRLGLVDITEAVIAAGRYSRDINPRLLQIVGIGHADGAVPPRLKELIYSTYVREQEKLIVRASLVEDVLPTPRPTRRNGHLFQGRFPVLAGDHAALVGAEPNQRDILFPLALPNEL